jgi:hypothetical protein
LGIYIALLVLLAAVYGLAWLARRYRWARALFAETKHTRLGPAKTRESYFRSALNFLFFTIPPCLLIIYAVLFVKPEGNEALLAGLGFIGFMLAAVFISGAALMFFIGLLRPSARKRRKAK